MARRLSTDAMIVLRNAGYVVREQKGFYKDEKTGKSYKLCLRVGSHSAMLPHCLNIDGGTVDNDEVEQLLKASK